MLKKILIPLIILVVLVFLAVILKSPVAKPVKDKKVITNFEPSQAARIELTQPGKDVVISREADKWFVTTSQNYPANNERITDFLTKVSHLKESDIVSMNQEKHMLFQVDSIQGRRLKIYDAKQSLLADFYVGKMGPDYMSTYIRLPDGNDVITVDVPLMWLASIDARQWLERVLFKSDVKDITQITIKSNTVPVGSATNIFGAETDTSSFTLMQDPEGKQEWSIIFPDYNKMSSGITPSGVACNKTVANELASAVSNINLDNVAPVSPTGAPITDLAVYGLAQPERSVTIISKNAFPFTLLIGKTTPTGDYYVKTESSNFVVMVNKNIISKLSKKLEDFIPPKPPEEPKKNEPKGTTPSEPTKDEPKEEKK